jgi:hypothetical protein
VSPVWNNVTLIGRRCVFLIHVEVVRTKERLFFPFHISSLFKQKIQYYDLDACVPLLFLSTLRQVSGSFFMVWCVLCFSVSCSGEDSQMVTEDEAEEELSQTLCNEGGNCAFNSQFAFLSVGNKVCASAIL